MPDQITRTTSQSWLSRIGGAFAGVLVGFVMIIACVIGLSWNEGRAVARERALKEGAGVVVSVEPTPIVAANDQKLIHVAGPTATTAELTDPAFAVTGRGLALSRQVEMYQWNEESKSETRTKLGGGEETVTTYTYTRVWSGGRVDSSAFAEPNGHQNPELEIEPTVLYAQDATLGDFRLDENVLSQVGGARALPIPAESVEAVRAAAGQSRPVTVAQNRIYIGADPATPVVGDVRVSYELTPTGDISVVGRQNGDRLADYETSNGQSVLLVQDGRETAAAMFSGAQSENRIVTWIIRGAGMVFLMVGFGLILAPLGVLADVLPLAGTIVRMGTGLIGFVLGLTLGTVTIAVSWFAFRPLLSVGLLAVGLAIAFAAWRFGRKRAKAAEAASA